MLGIGGELDGVIDSGIRRARAAPEGFLAGIGGIFSWTAAIVKSEICKIVGPEFHRVGPVEKGSGKI